MPTSTDRQPPSYESNPQANRPGAARAPGVNINQTSTAPRSSGNLVIALLVLAGIALAVFLSTSYYNPAPTVIQDNSSEVAPAPAPSPTPAPVTTTEDPATPPPATNTQPAEPATPEVAPVTPAPAPAPSTTPPVAPSP